MKYISILNFFLQDEFVLARLKLWQEVVNEIGSVEVGVSAVKLEKSYCSSRECNLGNFFTDAMVHAFIRLASYNASNWSNVSMALTTQGNFRVPLKKGILTYNHLYTMCPFENKFIALSLYGRDIREVLEIGVSTMNSNLQTPTSSRMLQVSGLKITYNLTKQPGERVDSVMVRCTKCNIPFYQNLDLNTVYRIVVSDYLAEGNNGFGVIKQKAFDLEAGPKDLDALIDYIEAVNPVVAAVEGRIMILT